MIKFIKNRLRRQTPRWLVFIIDVLVTFLTFIPAFAIIFRLNWPSDPSDFILLLVATLIVYSILFVIFKFYRGIIRHTGFNDMVRGLLIGVSALGMLTLFVSVVDFNFPKAMYSVLLVHFLINTMSLIFLRFAYKTIYFQYIEASNQKQNVMIYGAGESGIITYNALENERGVSKHVIGFIDDNPKVQKNKINGKSVYAFKKINKNFIEKNHIQEIIFSIQNISSQKLNTLVSRFENYPVTLKIVPPLSHWINGDLEPQQIKDIRIEDLLSRDPIQLEKESISNQLKDQTVLITGAAGSIGSEIAHQISHYPCRQIIFVDQAETPLYNLQQNCLSNSDESEINSKFIVSDIRDKARMQLIFERYKPDIVYHAAAYKHVPLMEENPYEAVSTNIKGTMNIVDCAITHKVSKFVLVSTDKAVNPTNVMGATKRVAELYVTYMSKKQKTTKFITTRFGNVLGSNGSVIPLFKKQILNGGPLTVTHKEVTRYFMTIPEACQLVLEAGAMGVGGEIFVFDMGESVKIYDLAKRMIQLSGLQYPNDIDIKIVGLRPGEKIFEELLADGENTMPTHHEKILIAQTECSRVKDFEQIISELTSFQYQGDESVLNMKLVSIIKKLTPEYISENSVYQSLDAEKAS